MEQLRTVWSEHGQIKYVLIRKKIKNLNLRIRNGGAVSLSIPLRCSLAQADDFVISKSEWIVKHLSDMEHREEMMVGVIGGDCDVVLGQALDRVWPLVAPYGIARPVLKVRSLRSQWGNCHWMRGYITLNSALYHCPESLREYVALHELVHFLHHDHGSGFYAVMDALMPDWKLRRKELKRYSGTIGK